MPTASGWRATLQDCRRPDHARSRTNDANGACVVRPVRFRPSPTSLSLFALTSTTRSCLAARLLAPVQAYHPLWPGNNFFALIVTIGGTSVSTGTTTSSDVMIPRISVALSTSTISQVDSRSNVLPDWS